MTREKGAPMMNRQTVLSLVLLGASGWMASTLADTTITPDADEVS
jgi:hypothetical protein